MAYPLPVFHFEVDWGGSTSVFSEVSGLTIEHQIIEYRHGLSKEHTMKMPGIPKHGNITLKRGIVKGDNEFYEWLSNKNLHKNEPRRNLTINLLDEEGNPVMTWKAAEAFPVKVEGPGLKASGNEVAIESIEIAHEGLTIEAS